MSKPSTGDTGQELVRGERGRFAAGAPSANPKGRPKRGESIAELVRRNTDWERLHTRLESIVHDPKAKHSDAIQAAVVLLDRGYGKAPQHLELSRGGGSDDSEDFSHLSLEQLRQALAERDEWTQRWLSREPAQLPATTEQGTT